MGFLTAAHRHHYYLQEATRAGIHLPLLVALYAIHQSPLLEDGEVGLGISPAHQLGRDQLTTFPQQVKIAASTLRSMTSRLTAQGWRASDIWDEDNGYYTDAFLQAIADGYSPPVSDPGSGLLETTDAEALRNVYRAEVSLSYQMAELPYNLSFLDGALLRFAKSLGDHYQSLDYQRQALLEAVRLWRKLDTIAQAIAALQADSDESLNQEITLDRVLLDVISKLPDNYVGYPHQREALLRLVQLWRQVATREGAIASLETSDTAEIAPGSVDAALIAFVQNLPHHYQGKGEQRNTLTETYRIWHDLDSRTVAIRHLGVEPKTLIDATPETLENAARQLDRALLQFIRTVPTQFNESESQRTALLKLVQLWRHCDNSYQARQTLLEDWQRMERATHLSEDAPPAPVPLPAPSRPTAWSPENLHLDAPILPHSCFTWAMATQGGIWMPDTQETVDTIVALAEVLQEVSDRLGRSLQVALWYVPPGIPVGVPDPVSDRHSIGNAIKVYSPGLSGNQLYWMLDPWWAGGLGRCQQFPHLVHLDRGDRTRWLQ